MLITRYVIVLYLRVDNVLIIDVIKHVDISGYWISVRVFRVYRDEVQDSVRHQGRVGVKKLKTTLNQKSVSM